MNCITSVAFREPYIRHSHTQEIRVKELCTDVDYEVYRDVLPIKHGGHVIGDGIIPHFQSSLYGFKPIAIDRVRNYSKVIWFDPSVLPVTSPQILFDALDIHPIIVRPGEEPLAKMCNAKAKKWFGVTDSDIVNERTVAGTIYGFNFNNPKAVEVFELWKKAEEEGIFGNQDAFMAGHWADEACLSLAMHKLWVGKYWCEEFKYLNQKEL